MCHGRVDYHQPYVLFFNDRPRFFYYQLLVGAVVGLGNNDVLQRLPFVLQPGAKTGLRIRYRNPLEVGPDRIANAIGGVHLYPGRNLIVIDFGTATTIDVVSATRDYLGGIILPGLRIGMEALEKNTARLPTVEILQPSELIGRSTVQSIQSGLYHGYAAMINGMLRLLRPEMEGTPRVLATGGLARVLAAELEGVDSIEDHLTLEGLRLIYEKNRTA